MFVVEYYYAWHICNHHSHCSHGSVCWRGRNYALIRLFAYADLVIRYQWIEFKMFMMRRKLEQQLIKDLPNFNKLAKELKKDDQ